MKIIPLLVTVLFAGCVSAPHAPVKLVAPVVHKAPQATAIVTSVQKVADHVTAAQVDTAAAQAAAVTTEALVLKLAPSDEATAIKTSTATLQASLFRVNADLVATQEELATTKAANAAFQKTVDELNASLNTVEVDKATLTNDKAELAAQVTSLDSQVRSLKLSNWWAKFKGWLSIGGILALVVIVCVLKFAGGAAVSAAKAAA